LNLWSTLAWASAGAILGDNISFWIGVYFQTPLKKSNLYQKHQNSFKSGEMFFQKYGAYSIALGRFIGPIRAVVPTIAGSMGMSGRLFFIINVFSAILWAPAYILPGMFAVDIYKITEKYIQIESWGFLFITFSILALFFYIKYIRYKK
jgi:membrane protein DedA with SNARE-associated domain